MNLGPTELIILLGIIVLLFGASRVPKLARSIGEASREFKKGVKEGDDEDKPLAAKPDQKVTMTQAELDALLAAERDAGARKDAPPAI